jgi:hypothetical protein
MHVATLHLHIVHKPEKMKMKRTVLLAAAALGALVSVSTTAKAEALMDPNLHYCLEATGGGYQTMNQCEESASGTGRECEANVWMDATVGGDESLHESMAQMRRAKRHH